MRSFLIIMIALIVFTEVQLAQNTSPDIEKYLVRVEKGEADQVRSELPSLLTKYPNNPGVLYLQGVVTTDGTEAVRIYQSIVDNFSKSDWADDALYKVYQFYYAIGLYRTAEIKLNQLTNDYPRSKYVTGIASTDIKNVPDERQVPDPPKVEELVVQSEITPPISEKPSRDEQAPIAVPACVQYTLQVGAYSQQVNAEKQKLFFEDLGYNVEVINKVRDARSLFVVLVGEYKNVDDARTGSDEVKKKYNINSMVVTK